MELPTTINTTNENSTKASPIEGFQGEPRILIAAIVEVIICIVGSTGNLLTCLAVMRNSTLQFATNFFIVSLAVADLLVCTILVPMRASQHFSFFLGKNGIHPLAVKVAGFLGRVNIVASICSLAALSIDRCIAIKYPMRYRFDIRYATRRVLGVIFGFWVYAIVFTSLPYVPGITDDVFLIGFIVFVLFVTFIIMLAYFRIFHVANQSRKRRKVGAVDFDLEEKTAKHKNSKKSLHVHFSTSSLCHDVSVIGRNSGNQRKPIKSQCSKSMFRASAARRFSGVPPRARSSSSAEIMEAQTQTNKMLLQCSKGVSQVFEFLPIETPNNSIYGHSNENANTNVHDETRTVKTLPELSRCLQHSASFPTSNRSAPSKKEAFIISVSKENSETLSLTALPTQSADLHMLNENKSAEDYPFHPSQLQGSSVSTEKALSVQSKHVIDVQERNTLNSKEDSVQVDLRAAQNLSSTNDPEEQRRAKRDRHKDHKTTKTIGIVIGAFIALVYPRIIMILYHYGNKSTPASLLAKFWVRILLYANSAVNPLLYAWRMRDFRIEFRKMIVWLFRCRRLIQRDVQIHPSQTVSIQSTTALSTDIAVSH